jgi:hypothetical protein
LCSTVTYIIESPEEQLIFPSLKPSPSESGNTQSANVNGEQNLTTPAGIIGWDDRGNSGQFSGGGGNVYFSGWRPGDPVGSRNNNKNGSGGPQNKAVSTALCFLIVATVSRVFAIA